jgi:hypothetical protein
MRDQSKLKITHYNKKENRNENIQTASTQANKMAHRWRGRMARMEEKKRRKRRGANWSKERQRRRSLWRVAVGVGRKSGDCTVYTRQAAGRRRTAQLIRRPASGS